MLLPLICDKKADEFAAAVKAGAKLTENDVFHVILYKNASIALAIQELECRGVDTGVNDVDQERLMDLIEEFSACHLFARFLFL